VARERPWTLHLPEPRNLWIRYRPRRWAAGEEPFLDLARGTLAWDSWPRAEDGPSPSSGALAFDDVVYLPCGEATGEDFRRRLVLELEAAGVPVVLQLGPRAEITVWERDWIERGIGGIAVLDVTSWLLDRERALVAEAVRGCVAAVPLLPGLLDLERFRVLAAALAERGAAAAHLVTPGASAATRRRLAERLDREDDYRAMFHAPPLEDRAFWRAAREAGLALGVARPLPAAPPRLRTRRFLAGLLLEAGDLWLRLDPTGRRAAPFFRASRFVDESALDLESLARDGNLRVLEWLEPEPRRLVEEALREGRSACAEELRRSWLSGVAPE
jgi:hypothetical protein